MDNTIRAPSRPARSLAGLYERTVLIFGEESDPGWAWVEEILPHLAPACRESVRSSGGDVCAPIPTIERWLTWESQACEVCLAATGSPDQVAARRLALRVLLTATLTVLNHPQRHSRTVVANDLLTLATPQALPGFGPAYCRYLIDYLCGDRGDRLEDIASVRIACPLVLSQSYVIDGRDTDVVIAEIEAQVVPGLGEGSIFLHPEQLGLRFFDDSFNRACFAQSARIASTVHTSDHFASDGTGQNIARNPPNIVLRLLAQKPSQKIYLTDALLVGPSASGAVAAAAVLLYRHVAARQKSSAASFAPREIPPDIAASVAVIDTAGNCDGRLHGVGSLDEKIRGCARAGITTLFVAASQNSPDTRRAAARNGDIQIVGVTDLDDLVSRLDAASGEQSVSRSPGKIGKETVATVTLPPLPVPKRVSLLYKRGLPEDEHLLELLEAHLVRQGHEVFIDRNLRIGVEWEAEIDRQVKSADAAVILLSEGSIHSEALLREVQTADAAALASGGHRPLLIPVRIRYEGVLPEGLDRVLGRLQYTLWEGDADSLRVASQVEEAVNTPTQDLSPRRAPVLPSYFDPFIGRAEEKARLVKRLCDPNTRLVTLTGTGGSGKTRLATEAARTAAPAFHGAVWFVSLVGIADPALLTEHVLRTLGLARRSDRDAYDEIAAELSGGPALLVLDNFEQIVVAGRDFVRGLLERVPTLTCLVTSRIRLGLTAEQEWEVAPLPVPKEADVASEVPSVQLFVDCARRRRPDFSLDTRNEVAVAELCRRLDGLPLALRLAASWSNVLTPAQMLTRIRKILVSQDGDVPNHHRSLDAALDISYRLLDADTRRFFARFSVFRGGCTLEPAETVCTAWPQDPPQLDALVALERLEAASLLSAEESGGEMRYQVLETVRNYAQERLIESGEEEYAAQRHQRYFFEFAEEGQQTLNRGVDRAACLERLEREHRNLHVALSRAAPVERLPVVTGLQRFWKTHGHLQEGRRWLGEDLSTVVPAELSAPLRRDALLAAADLENTAGEHDAALDYLREGMQQCKSDRDCFCFRLAEATTLHYLGRDAEARRSAEEAHALGVSAFGADGPEMVDYHNLMGVILKMSGDRTEARRHYGRALELAERARNGDPERMATCLGNLGTLLEDEGDLLASLAHLWRALRIDREVFGRRHPKAAIRHNNLGRVWAKRGNWHRALRHHQQALAIYQKTYTHPHLDIGMSQYYLANALKALKRHREAREYYLRALPVLERHFGRDHPRCQEVHATLPAARQDNPSFIEN